MSSLPNDYRINKAALRHVLQFIAGSFDNPNTQRFIGAIQDLPNIIGKQVFTDNGAVSIHLRQSVGLCDVLKQLKPWRKGPFQLGDVMIDSEWQSNMKWDRFIDYYPLLSQKHVLDIGCGNGYYMFRMLEHHPSLVVGIDPSHLTYFQYHSIRHFLSHDRLQYLPIGWNDLGSFSSFFDVVFCMGIMYHHRSPVDLLQTIRSVSNDEVTLFFDTLIMDGDDDVALFPQGRYAQMPNVYFIPTLSCLKNMLTRSGFSNIDILSVDQTTIEEQRVTDWTFEQSLAHFLDPNDSSKTIEGYPAPLRVALVATLKNR